MYFLPAEFIGFGTVRNNTALKLHNHFFTFFCFGTIRNNIALKYYIPFNFNVVGFETIRNNIALKQH